MSIVKQSNKVLILGNGISRLSFDKYIKTFKGQIWGANRVYLDYGKKLDLISGHIDVMQEAKEYREKHNLNYQIIGGHIEPDSAADILYTCPKEFRLDTGTTLIAEALKRKMQVSVVGFDLGGPDVYSLNHQNFNKQNWVNRWRKILEYYGHDKIKFIGYDHLPYLLSKKLNDEYASNYLDGKSHIDDTSYNDIYYKWREEKKLNFLRMIKMATLINNSKRTFSRLLSRNKDFNPGDAVTMPDSTAALWVKRYPKEFKMIKAEVVEKEKPKPIIPKVAINDNVKAIIKGIKGVGIKSAVAVFLDKGAMTEKEQIEILNEIKEKKNG